MMACDDLNAEVTAAKSAASLGLAAVAIGSSVGQRESRQKFVMQPQAASKCSSYLPDLNDYRNANLQTHTNSGSGSNSVDCVMIKAAGDCVTVLAQRWPWWVSLLPCDTSDTRQFWIRRNTTTGSTGGMQLISNFVTQPWPSGSTGKCMSGPCPRQGCLEVEGANPEVDQCNWSTNSSQFVWDATVHTQTGRLRNILSGQCLAPAADLEIYAGPLAGGKWTAVLLNRSPSPSNITLQFTALPASELASFSRGRVRDILEGSDLGEFDGSYTAYVRSHAVAHVVVTPSKQPQPQTPLLPKEESLPPPPPPVYSNCSAMTTPICHCGKASHGGPGFAPKGYEICYTCSNCATVNETKANCQVCKRVPAVAPRMPYGPCAVANISGPGGMCCNPGAFHAGSMLRAADVTLAAALEWCNSTAACGGFTANVNPAHNKTISQICAIPPSLLGPSTVFRVYFTSRLVRNGDSRWASWHKPTFGKPFYYCADRQCLICPPPATKPCAARTWLGDHECFGCNSSTSISVSNTHTTGAFPYI